MIEQAAGSAPLRELRRRLEQGGALTCRGCDPAARPFLAVVLRQLLPARSLVVVHDGLKAQERWQEELRTWIGAAEAPLERPLFYPAWEVLPHEERLPHADVISERIETLTALLAGRTAKSPTLVNTTVAALLQKTFPPKLLHARARALRRGEKIDPLELARWLEEQGYAPEIQVTRKGDLAARGGILDLFPLTSAWPARIEFFGDEIESLRLFDPVTQISREEVAEVVVSPADEFGLLRKIVQSDGAPALATLLDYLPPRTVFLLSDPDHLDARAAEYAAQIPSGDPFFLPWPDLLGAIAGGGFPTLRLISEPGLELMGEEAPEEAVAALDEQDAPPSAASRPDPSPPTTSPCPPQPWRRRDPSPTASPIAVELDNLDFYRPLTRGVAEAEVAQEQRRQFFRQLDRWLRQDYRVAVFCGSESEKQRFHEIWEEFAPERSTAGGSKQREAPGVEIATLERGFIFPAAALVAVSDAEVFGRLKARRPRRLAAAHAAVTRSAFDINFSEFEEGDYVVHLQHGVGRFLGLQLLPSSVAGGLRPREGGAEPMEEFLAIEYAAGDPMETAPKLYVPAREAYLVGKYVGSGNARPPLNVLGGGRWGKTRARAEEAVRDLASDFLALQAARASQPGRAFKPDDAWQREFESAFPYEETPGQLRAIEETKRDMESARPMDRLICGDVGFGKTEVAVRAAFKAVMDGAQTAILTPTTILAQQHFNTFRERMADYPARIELLSRYRSPREQRKVLEGLEAGTVDIVIGTHRLLQRDVRFKDLGLVVIDEEQRFGVLDKEKFKQLRRLVDVLTLSATPIPRTLHMALTGARDLSTIETPPQDRLPVETIVAPYDERLIRDAIQRELNRGGQVFYLHNRVFDIESAAARLRALLPRARIVVGHGQMGADELEEIMTRFVGGEADVLLCTTIIESGLDIPNANTIIIDRADRFGLSDLYQLRGRVGRYKHQAYAYLLFPRQAGLLADARKRLSALRQHSALGSGFKIAMRDLEIRGAGNLLGAEQSGHIAAVGFDLYCQLLKQAVSALKGETVKPRREVFLKLDFLALSPDEEGSASGAGAPRETRAAAYISRTYIPETRHRLEVYRKLAQASSRAELARLLREVQDRFGKPPEAVGLLWRAGDLKLLAAERGVTSIESRGDRLMIGRDGDFLMTGGKFPLLWKKDPKERLEEARTLVVALSAQSKAAPAARRT